MKVSASSSNQNEEVYRPCVASADPEKKNVCVVFIGLNVVFHQRTISQQEWKLKHVGPTCREWTTEAPPQTPSGSDPDSENVSTAARAERNAASAGPSHLKHIRSEAFKNWTFSSRHHTRCRLQHVHHLLVTGCSKGHKPLLLHVSRWEIDQTKRSN